jgi:hypothetical protein
VAQASEIAEKVAQIASFGRGSESAARKINRLPTILSRGFQQSLQPVKTFFSNSIQNE